MGEHIDLGGFLRARREALTPGEVGLRSSGHRRTPGLRREEVATLAGVSVDYIVRLEQGRDRKPSPSVLAALADALLLTDDERRHLYTLASIAGSPELCPSSFPDAERQVPDTVLSLLEALDPTPAYVLSPWAEVLAANAAWRTFAAPLGLLEREHPNLAAFTFLDPRSRQAFPDWSAMADRLASDLRLADVRWGRDALMAPVIEELMTSAEFAERWARQDVAERRRGEKRLQHPSLGLLRLVDEVLLLPDGADQRLVTLLAADERSAAALAALATPSSPGPTSPARLRVVS